MFNGNIIVSNGPLGHSQNGNLATVNTVGNFYCESGWMLHKAIKQMLGSDNIDRHKIICTEHGWFVLKDDGKTVGPRLQPCVQKKTCKVKVVLPLEINVRIQPI